MTTADEKAMQELLGRAIADEEFRARLRADPVAAAAELGLRLTDEQSAALKATDLSGLSEGLDVRLSKSRRSV